MCKKSTELKDDIANMLVELMGNEIGNICSIDKVESKMIDILNDIRKQATENIFEKKDPVECSCECGEAMINHQKRPITVVGLASYTVNRRSFLCPKCQIYVYPLDKIMEIEGKYTLEIKKAMTLFGQRMPFEESSDYLEKILRVSVSDEKIRDYVETIGEKIASDEKKESDRKVGKNGHIIEWEGAQPQKQGAAYMQLDGSMVQTRELGWKEVRNGILFRDKDNVQSDKNHKLILNKKYFSIFNTGEESLDCFKNRATQEAYYFGFHCYENPVILGDGAKWIWNYATTHHPYAIQILDYYHASEYLGEACSALKLLDNSSGKKGELFDLLWEGKIQLIINYLSDQQSLHSNVIDCISYFTNNKHRMKYKEYRNKGIDIGSGAIESAHRIIVQTRMKHSGMHWGKNNVQSIVSLRSKYLSGEWRNIVDDYLLAA